MDTEGSRLGGRLNNSIHPSRNNHIIALGALYIGGSQNIAAETGKGQRISNNHPAAVILSRYA